MRKDVYIKSLPLSELQGIIGLVGYEGGKVVQRELSGNQALTISLFAMDKGLVIRPKITPGPALLQILEGTVRIHTGDLEQRLTAGKTLVLAAGRFCDLSAMEPSKLLLTLILEPEVIGIATENEDQ